MAGFRINKKDYPTFEELAAFAAMSGNDDDLYVINTFGQNVDVDSGQTEDLWIAGGTRALPGAAETFTIVSDDAEDDTVKADESAGTAPANNTAFSIQYSLLCINNNYVK